jgi:hypothetical protein
MKISEIDSRMMSKASRGIYHCWMEDVERLDELIGRYLPVALSGEQDFNRALRAAYVIMELIEMKWELLESYPKGTP